MKEVSFLHLCCMAPGSDGNQERLPENDPGHCQRTRGAVLSPEKVIIPRGDYSNISASLPLALEVYEYADIGTLCYKHCRFALIPNLLFGRVFFVCTSTAIEGQQHKNASYIVIL